MATLLCRRPAMRVSPSSSTATHGCAGFAIIVGPGTLHVRIAKSHSQEWLCYLSRINLLAQKANSSGLLISKCHEARQRNSCPLPNRLFGRSGCLEKHASRASGTWPTILARSAGFPDRLSENGHIFQSVYHSSGELARWPATPPESFFRCGYLFAAPLCPSRF